MQPKNQSRAKQGQKKPKIKGPMIVVLLSTLFVEISSTKRNVPCIKSQNYIWPLSKFKN
jgi:hypothetical protein